MSVNDEELERLDKIKCIKQDLDAMNHQAKKKQHQESKKNKAKKVSKSKKSSNISTVNYRVFSNIESKPVEWLWPGIIALRKVSLFAGHPGLGKSQITTSLAGVITTGGLWPVSYERSIQGKVVFISSEDDAEDTIKHRLEAVKADLSQCIIFDSVNAEDTTGLFIKRSFNLKNDLDKLGDLVSRVGNVRLVIIDPITAYLGAVDSHKNADVQALFCELSDFSKKYNIAILGISHLNKSTNQDALSRVNGSGAFVSAARSAYIIAKDENTPDRRYFLPLKNNLAKDTSGFAFSIVDCMLENGIETSCIKWEDEPVNKTPEEVLNQPIRVKDNSQLEKSKQFIVELLGDGEKPTTEIKECTNEAGFSWATIKRAKNELNIKPHRNSSNGAWFWSLLRHAQTPHAQTPFSINEHLEQGHGNKEIATCSTPPHAQTILNENVEENKQKNIPTVYLGENQKSPEKEDTKLTDEDLIL